MNPPVPLNRSRERILFAFQCRCKTMEVKIKEQDEDNTFSNTDANGEIIHILIKAKGAIHHHNVKM